MGMPNWTIIESTWRQWKSQALIWWGRLSDAEWDEINGNREKLLELLQIRYGWNREEALQEIESRFQEYISSLL